jgi:hypothetical protein
MKIDLTPSQYRITSEIAGNIATAWFVAGVISPIFVKPQNIVYLFTTILLGLIMTSIFVFVALTLARKSKND